MRKWIAFALCLCMALAPTSLGAASAKTPADGAARKVGIVVESVTNPADQNDGRLYATYEEGILLLRYDPAYKGPAELCIAIATSENTQVLRQGDLGTVTGLKGNGLISPSYEGGAAYNEMVLPIQMNSSIRTLALTVTCGGVRYETASVPVLWLPTSLGPPIDADIWPGEDIAIGVGQELVLGVELKGDYTDKRYSLSASSYDTVVGVSDGAILGVQLGEQVVAVHNGEGQLIASVNVTVQKEETTYERPVVSAPAAAKYQVRAYTVSVYPQANFSQRRIGTLPMGQVVSVVWDDGRWAQLLNGTFVLSQNLKKL